VQDAHNHLQDPRLDVVREDLIEAMIEQGVTRCVVNGTSPRDWPQVANLAKSHPKLIIPSFGLHPWQKPTSDWLEKLTVYLDTIPHACVGECGLDRWIKDYDIKTQQDIFETQLEIAAERNLPLSIHCLKAWGLMIEILESKPRPERGFLLHSYSGPAELVPRLTILGAYFSFSGYFLHDHKKSIRDTFKIIPPDRLLLETDAPDMRPPDICIKYDIDNRLNHPANISKIGTEASQFLDTSQTKSNFERFFEMGF